MAHLIENSKLRPFLEGYSKHFDLFSKRETEVAFLLIHGLSAKEIARRLYISYETVEKHRYNLKRKIKCSSSCEMGAVILAFFEKNQCFVDQLYKQFPFLNISASVK